MAKRAACRTITYKKRCKGRKGHKRCYKLKKPVRVKRCDGNDAKKIWRSVGRANFKSACTRADLGDRSKKTKHLFVKCSRVK